MATPDSRCWGVIPAAGIGSRMAASVPKQYLDLLGRSVLERSLAALLENPLIEQVVVAVHPDDERPATLDLLNDPRVRLVMGGDARSDSVLAGLNALTGLAGEEDWVLVHDAARPCVLQSDISALCETVISSGVGGILAARVVETVKCAGANGRVSQTLDRNTLWRAQTPQMFRLGLLRDALENARDNALDVTDEASAMELAGHPVQLLAGSACNLKVTLPEDLALAAFYLRDNGDGCE